MKKRPDNPIVRASAVKATAKEIETLVQAVAAGEVRVKHLGSFSIMPVEGSPIYVLTAIQWNDLDTRRWGWYPDKEQAIAAVLRNDGDLYEHGHYPFIVVEELKPGIMPFAGEDRRWWYVWEGDYETGGYRPTPCPTKYEYVIGFGMG